MKTLLSVACMLQLGTPARLGTAGVAIAVPTAAVALQPQKATIDSFVVNSRVLGEARRINVYVPKGYDASKARFPVLYMPDGGLDEDFLHVTATVDSLFTAHAIRPTIVVGIPNTERRRDLTGPTRIKSDSAVAPRVGESEKFRVFINNELFPEIEKRYRTTGERTIIGESFAGLFVVETFLLRPAMFDHYIALDASMWWNGGPLADSATTFIRRMQPKSRTLYLAISDIKEMGEGVTKLDRELRAHSPKGLTWSYLRRLDLTHATIFRALEGPALESALR